MKRKALPLPNKTLQFISLWQSIMMINMDLTFHTSVMLKFAAILLVFTDCCYCMLLLEARHEIALTSMIMRLFR